MLSDHERPHMSPVAQLIGGSSFLSMAIERKQRRIGSTSRRACRNLQNVLPFRSVLRKDNSHRFDVRLFPRNVFCEVVWRAKRCRRTTCDARIVAARARSHNSTSTRTSTPTCLESLERKLLRYLVNGLFSLHERLGGRACSFLSFLPSFPHAAVKAVTDLPVLGDDRRCKCTAQEGRQTRKKERRRGRERQQGSSCRTASESSTHERVCAVSTGLLRALPPQGVSVLEKPSPLGPTSALM